MPASLIKDFRFAPTRKIYERQPGEPESPWRAFVIFRDMGQNEERSLSGATKKYMERYHKKAKFLSVQANLYRWKGQFDWERRANEWDSEIDRTIRRQRHNRIEAMRERHIEIGKGLQALGSGELMKYLRVAKASGETVVPINDMLSLLREGMRVERLNEGEPESIQESKNKSEIEVKGKEDVLERVFGGSADQIKEHEDKIIQEIKKKKAREMDE